MRIIVSDSSCLIDLRKAGLLEALLSLPYEVLIPNTLFEDELLKFTAAQKRALLRGGLQVVDLPGASVLRAQAVIGQRPGLTIHDGFAFALAESVPGCILLTGDGGLRSFAAGQDMEVRGVLWLVDEFHRHGIVAAEDLLSTLRLFEQDPAVRLPPRTLASYIRRYQALGQK